MLLKRKEETSGKIKRGQQQARQVRKVTRVWVWDAGCGRGKARTTRIDEDASDGHDDSTSKDPSNAPAGIMHEGTGPEPGQSWSQKPLGFGGPGKGVHGISAVLGRAGLCARGLQAA